MTKTVSNDSGYGESNDTLRKPAKTAPLYGIVQYDFQAERPDELDAKAGEAIIIIAQSNHEWFVAKPIGRLGGPGLIPVSFIEIRDMATGKPISNLEELAAKAAVPKVEEWKRAAAEYKNSSIPLGRFDFDRKDEIVVPVRDQMRTSDYSSGSGTEDRRRSEALYVARASVDQFLLDGSRYWFLVRAEMNDGRHRNLCRYYEDFYDFQIALLEEFPVEAGRTGEQRILPFMPGPLTYVDDTISAQRRADLSVYVEELCRLPAHVVRNPLVQALFATREGDVESTHPTSMMPQPIYKPGQTSRGSATSKRSSRASISHNARTSGNVTAQPDLRVPPTNNTTSRVVSGGGAPTLTKSRDASQGNAMMKIKVFYDDDLIAIRVPADIDYQRLRGKLSERLSGQWSTISYKDEARGQYHRINTDADFQNVLAKAEKIVLYVQ